MQGLVVIANGTEEMEAVIVIDILRRAEITTTVVSLDEKAVKCSRGVVLMADTQDIPTTVFDVIVLPGGMQGALAFAKDFKIRDLLHRHLDKCIAVICASPIALEKWQIHTNSTVTSHPSVKDQLKSYNYSESRVVVDKMITSQGPGTAIEFALAIVEKLRGKQLKDKISQVMVVEE
eukprot:NODE_1085_length_1350_cov_0.712230.p1 type:complete len:177 gc:universal NODE_1085_length_1350_cov_0.712230:598-1128(+)